MTSPKDIWENLPNHERESKVPGLIWYAYLTDWVYLSDNEKRVATTHLLK